MSRKGLPRCKRCRYVKWRTVKRLEASDVIECKNCGNMTVTRSVARFRLTKIKEEQDEFSGKTDRLGGV